MTNTIAHWYDRDPLQGELRFELCRDDDGYFIWSAHEQRRKDISLAFAQECWDNASENNRGPRPEKAI